MDICDFFLFGYIWDSIDILLNNVVWFCIVKEEIVKIEFVIENECYYFGDLENVINVFVLKFLFFWYFFVFFKYFYGNLMFINIWFKNEEDDKVDKVL